MDAKIVVNNILEGVSVREALMQATIKDPATGKYVDVDFENPWDKNSKSSSEYIQHYSGELGEFDYDIREFKLDGFLYYIGTETDGSKIKIPTGIKICRGMFFGYKSLTKAPEIPNSVKDCGHMFDYCKSLKTPPVIPDSVKGCDSMFAGCTSLTKAPVIPNGVEDCCGMFFNCESLTKVPVIPDSVKDCLRMFYGCSEEVREAGQWNIEHRGQSYYDQA